MSSFMLQVCGLNLLLRCPGGVEAKETDDAYQAFFKALEEGHSADIEIDLSFGVCNGRHAGTALFQSEQSWSMYRMDHGYCLELKPAGFSHTVWQASIDPTFSRVSLVYPPDSLQTSPNPDWIYNPLRYPFDQILLMHYLAFCRGAIVHSAGLKIEDMGIIFPGRSGAGKSTLSLSAEKDPAITIFSDDRMIVREIDGLYYAAGTPWPGEAGHAVNDSFPLKALLFLKHSKQTQIQPLSSQQSLEKLLPVSSIPWYHAESVTKMLQFFEDLIAHVPAYELSFKPGGELVDVLKTFSKQHSKNGRAMHPPA